MIKDDIIKMLFNILFSPFNIKVSWYKIYDSPTLSSPTNRKMSRYVAFRLKGSTRGRDKFEYEDGTTMRQG